jgi:UTP:GlnB (protein PII) uridylyltransferase
MESLVVAETYLVAKSFLKTVNKKFETKMEEKAGDDLKKPNYVLAIKNESAIVGGSSSSSQSAQANFSTKSKAGKSKKSAPVAASTNDEETTLEIQFIDRANLVKELKLIITDANDDLVEALIEHLLK